MRGYEGTILTADRLATGLSAAICGGIVGNEKIHAVETKETPLTALNKSLEGLTQT